MDVGISYVQEAPFWQHEHNHTHHTSMAFLLNVSKEYAEQVWQNARKIINDKKCELLHKSIFRQIVAESKSEQRMTFFITVTKT